MTEQHQCIQEARITAIETKLENKKEHLQEVDTDYYHLRDKLENISINVAELQSTVDTFKWLLPVACTILTFIVNYLI